MFATFLQPHEKVRELFDAYRSAYVDTGLPGGGGIAFMPLVFTGDSEAEAEAGARELLWYLDRQDRAAVPQSRPATCSVELNVAGAEGRVRRTHRRHAGAGSSSFSARRAS